MSALSKVGDLCSELGIEENVFRLEVAVNEPDFFAMDVCHAECCRVAKQRGGASVLKGV